MASAQQMMETIKASFLFQFRTGNVILDTVVTGLIIMLSTYFLSLAQGLVNLDIISLFARLRSRKTTKIVIAGKKVQGMHATRLEYSTNFFAVLHQIKKLDCVASEITQLSEVPIQEPNQAQYHDETSANGDGNLKQGVRTNLIVSQSHPFRLTADVYGLVNISHEADNNDKNPLKTEEFTIQICSDTLTAEDLRQLLLAWVKEYEGHLNSDKHLRYFVYTPSGDSHEDHYDATCHYAEFRFESGKSFDNIFFPEKAEILNRINFFTNNKEWYKRRGIPYTLGFLLYGEPGCGKTSTIKAIANLTQRHIVSVPLNKIKSGKELLNVFYNVKMNYKDIPLNNRLYVLEDIDCADLKSVVGDRGAKDASPSSSSATGGAEDTDTESDKDAKEMSANFDILSLLKSSSSPMVEGPLWKKTPKLTLSTLLEVLDGVMEMDGRMLIVTTNYPEKLDKALIRPGRIDAKLRFGRCTPQSLVEMWEHYFERRLPEESAARANIPDDKWTPAEATQIFLNNLDTPEKGLEELVTLQPVSFH